jgi:hypothetical protein
MVLQMLTQLAFEAWRTALKDELKFNEEATPIFQIMQTA